MLLKVVAALIILAFAIGCGGMLGLYGSYDHSMKIAAFTLFTAAAVCTIVAMFIVG